MSASNTLDHISALVLDLAVIGCVTYLGETGKLPGEAVASLIGSIGVARILSRSHRVPPTGGVNPSDPPPRTGGGMSTLIMLVVTGLAQAFGNARYRALLFCLGIGAFLACSASQQATEKAVALEVLDTADIVCDLIQPLMGANEPDIAVYACTAIAKADQKAHTFSMRVRRQNSGVP